MPRVAEKTFPFVGGSKISFSERSIGKLNVPAIKESGVADAILDLLQIARFAYSQVDYQGAVGKHTQRNNVVEYQNYVAAFDNGEGPRFCRFTVMHFNDARLVSHGAMVSE